MSSDKSPTELRDLDSVDSCQEGRLVTGDSVEPSADGIILLDHNLNVRQINTAASRIMSHPGADSSSPLGRNIADLLGEDRSNGLYQQCEAVLETGEPLTIHKALGDTGNGNRSLRITILRTETGLGMVLSDVTVRKQAERALRESEERYRLVVENANEAIIVTQEGAVKFANAKAADIIGYSAEEVTSIPFANFIHPDDRPGVVDRHWRRLNGESVSSVYESRVVTRQGEVRWVEISAVRLQWEGSPGTLNFVSDISERKQAEQALRDSESRFRNVLDNSVDMIYQLNLESGVYDYVSPASAKVIGYTPAEFLGLTFEAAASLVHPDDMERLAANVVQLTSHAPGSGKSSKVEYRFSHKRLGYRWMIDSRSVVLDEQGTPVAVAGTLRDITDRKRAEQAIRASETQFRAIFNYAAIGVILLDSDGHLVRINPAFRHMLGYSVKELRGMAPDEYIHPDDVAVDAALFKEVITGGRNHYQVEKRLIDRDGRSIRCRVTVSAVRDFAGLVLFGIAMIEDTTEQTLAEEALRRSEERFRALIENTQDVIAVLDEDRTITFNTPSVERVLGYTPDELASIDAFHFVHPDDQPPALTTLQHLISAPGEPQTHELRVRHKDGSWRIIEINANNLCAHPAVRGIVINFRDVTKRREAEDAVRESEQNYRVLFDSVMEGLVVIDAETMRLVLANEAAARMCEFDSVQQVLEADFLQHIHPDDKERAARIIADDMFQKDLRQVNEFRMITRHGKEKWVSAVGTRIEYRGRVAGLGSFTDITKHKRAEEELRRHRRHLEQLVQGRTAELTDTNRELAQQIAVRKKAELDLTIKENAIASSINAIAIADTNGTLLYVNASFLTMWGYESESEVVGQSAETFWRMGSKTLGLLDAFRETRNWTGELVATRKDGSYFDVHVSASTVPDEEGAPSCFMASFIDITERKRNEAKLEKLYNRERRLRQQLEEEMNRRIEFTRALAHELKTPLTPVLMSSQILASQLNEPTMVRLANNVAKGASNLNSRIDELLDLAKGEIGMLHLKLEQIDMLQVLREIIEEVASVPASHNQSFVPKLPPSLPPSLPPIWADRTRLRQIILNLLNNAFKYTPEGGRITLTTRHDDSNIVIQIHDTGPGISKEEQQRLFQPYHRLESDRERLSGLGLGLALSKTLVQLHGGHIWVDSTPTKGSTFAFSLPLREPPAMCQETP